MYGQILGKLFKDLNVMGTESGGGEEGSNRPTVTSLRLYLPTGDAHGLDLSHEAGTALWDQ